MLSYSVSPLSGQVSKWFRTIAHNPEIWKALYANAIFLRPPGPFPTASFERAFVRSARLARSWTTQSLQAVSRVSVPFYGYATEDAHLVGGRWLLVCEKDRRFVLYDTNPGAETRAPQVLWTKGKRIHAWEKCLAISEEGQWIVYVLMMMPPGWTLLEFRLDAESGALCETIILDVPVSRDDRRLELYGGQKPLVCPPFLTIPSQNLVFDTRTRVFYGFPNFRIALDTTRSWLFPRQKLRVSEEPHESEGGRETGDAKRCKYWRDDGR